MYIDRLYVLFDYDTPVKEILHWIKFEKSKRLAVLMGKLLSQLELPEADAIVPVPLSKKRLIERGFNQSLLMAEVVSKRKRVPLFENALIKIRDISPQSLLSGKKRLRNPIGAYYVKKALP